MAWLNLSSNLKQRIVSAAILAPLVLGVICVGGFLFTGMIVAAAIIMAFEWHDMTVLHANEADKTHARLWQSAGIFYILLPCMALILLREMESGLGIIFWLLTTVWATDIAAYFAGRAIGGPKLAPRISPNKTWAGLIGGMLAASITGFIAALLLSSPAPATLTLLGGILAVVAQAGDLLESGLKRHFGIKDSGTIIPGHGGLLDRVDGILTTAPAVGLIVLCYGEGLF